MKTKIETAKALLTEGMKSLEGLQKLAAEKAKVLAEQLPSAAESRKLTNAKILSSLKKLGVATQSEVESLTKKIAKLESELAAAKKSAKASAAAAQSTSTETNA